MRIILFLFIVSLMLAPSAEAGRRRGRCCPCSRQCTLRMSPDCRVIDVPREAPQTLTAEQARQAVLDLIRCNPGMFIGDPDVDRLAALPLIDQSDGKFSFGIVHISTTGRWYSAFVGEDGPEPYHYSGTIECRNGKWVATEPNLQRFHRLMP